MGVFYDRIGFTPFENATLNNGVNQVEYTVFNPSFYPNIPPLSSLNSGQNTINRVEPNLRADYSLQSAIGVERQIPGNTTLSVTFTTIAPNICRRPFPSTPRCPAPSIPCCPRPNNGIFPYGYGAGNIFDYESGGILRQHILMVNFNTRFNRRVSLAGNYSLNYAHDLPSTPSDPYDFALDYGRSNLDRRHNFQMFGSVLGPKGVTFAPFVIVRSGAPYDALLGQDVFGDTYFNARPVLAGPGAACGGDIVCTPFGNFNTNPAAVVAGSNLVPRNYLTMAGLFSLNLRVYRVFGFGERAGSRAVPGDRGGGGPGGRGGGGFGGPGGGMRMGPLGGGRGGFFGAGSEHRFNLTLAVSLTNILNHVNPGGYQGVLTSNEFGQPTSVNTGFGGGFGGGARRRTRRTRGVRGQQPPHRVLHALHFLRLGPRGPVARVRRSLRLTLFNAKFPRVAGCRDSIRPCLVGRAPLPGRHLRSGGPERHRFRRLRPARGARLLASIFGTNLASTTASASVFPLPTSLGGASVTIAGASVPLLYASPTQVNFQVPSALKAGSASLVVDGPGGASASFTFAVTSSAPAIFQYGANHAWAQNGTTTVVNSSTAAAASGSSSPCILPA